MDKPNIAIICGGYSGEAEVSQRSAKTILKHIDQKLFTPYLVTITREAWCVADAEGRSGEIDRSLVAHFDDALETVRFSLAYITIHGTPGEDGLLQGYLDMLGIPYTTGGVLCEALTFNKEACNAYLAHHGHRIARSKCLKDSQRRLSRETAQEIEAGLRLPLFVKPNRGGSSIATTRVDSWEQLAPAIELAYTAAPDVLVEECIVGTEVTCGCVMLRDEAFALPVTEVVAHDTFFDYDAKYYGKSDEITPARISPELTKRVQETSLAIAHQLDCYGFVRIDYIIEADGIPTLLEVNTTPGMTEQSFIPQQVRAAGLSLSDLLTRIITSKLS